MYYSTENHTCITVNIKNIFIMSGASDLASVPTVKYLAS